MNPRNYTWLKEASLIFIDSPVGAGFSYVDNLDAMTTTVYEVADDLVTTLDSISSQLKKKFYNDTQLPQIFIFSESYGGKVAPVFGQKIVEAQKKGRLEGVVLGGVAIGDGAVSLLDSALTYPEYLFQTSQIDLYQYKGLMEMTYQMEASYKVGDYNASSEVLGYLMDTINNITDDIFFYNIIYHHQPNPSLNRSVEDYWAQQRELKKAKEFENMSKKEQRAVLRSTRMAIMEHFTIDYNGDNVKKLMNTKMRKKFGIIPDSIIWGAQAVECHSYLADEMIIDVIDSVDSCLASGVRVIIYNGMLDLIINSAGQDRWISRLDWDHLGDYYQQPRIPLYPPSLVKDKRTGAFFKAYKNFEYYWVLMSGHMVPIDVPEMSLEIMRRIINNVQY